MSTEVLSQFTVAPDMYDQAWAFAQWQNDCPVDLDRIMDALSDYEEGLLANIGTPEGWCLLAIEESTGRLLIEDEDGNSHELVKGA